MTARRMVPWLLLLLGAGSPAYANPPPTITLQGVLRDNLGQLQSMVITVQVSFYSAQTGGTLLASVTTPNVPAENGVFSVNITDATFMLDLGQSTEVWTEIYIPGVGTFPRQQVTSTLFALQAASLSCSDCVGTKEINVPSGATPNAARTLMAGANLVYDSNADFSISGAAVCMVTATLQIDPSAAANTLLPPTWHVYRQLNGGTLLADPFIPATLPITPANGGASQTRTARFIVSGANIRFGCEVDVQGGSDWLYDNAYCQMTWFCF